MKLREYYLFIILFFNYLQAGKIEHLNKLRDTGECENCDLNEIDMRAVIKGLSKRLPNKPINLTGAHLVGALFSEMPINNINFSHANLSGADFYQSIVTQCNFQEALLHNTNFQQSSLAENNFTNASFCFVMDGDFFKRKQGFPDFKGACLRQNTFSDENIIKKIKSKADKYFDDTILFL